MERGADYGWPECYFDDMQKKLVLAPEYGGDGGHAVGVCGQKRGPIAAFPAHWAPNDLVLYTGDQFPAAYRGGAFIAFHGSWNRAPFPQGGYNVVFQPLADGKPAGDYVVFADGFAGAVKEPGQAAHRPAGLAVGPDGALYIADDAHGRIWRVTFRGDTAATGVEFATAPWPGSEAAAPDGQPAGPPEGIHPDAGAEETGALPTPPGATAAQVALGERVFHGEVGDGTCAGCHGSNAEGTPLGPRFRQRPVAVGRWQPGGDHADHHRRRSEPEGIPGRDAADGWRRALSVRGRGRGGLRLGAGPPERRLALSPPWFGSHGAASYARSIPAQGRGSAAWANPQEARSQSRS